MLSFSTQSLLKGAVQVDGEIDPDDKVWVEGDQRPEGSIRVTGRLSAAGPGRYYFSGRLAGATLGECRRCLIEVRSEVDVDTHILFADGGKDVDDDDPDVYPLQQGRSGMEVDLRPAVREQWLLEVSPFVLCRPDCKGLCTTCGANMNQGACSCARTT